MIHEWRDPKDILNFLKEEPYIDIKTDRGIYEKVIACNFMGTPCIPFKSHYFYFHKKTSNLCPDENDVGKFTDYDGGPRSEVLEWRFWKQHEIV